MSAGIKEVVKKLACLKCLTCLNKSLHHEVSFVMAHGVPGSQGATTRAWQHAYSEAAMQRTTMKVLGNVQNGLTILQQPRLYL